MQEIWKPCQDYPELSVSNYGRVKKGNIILKQKQEPQGYLRVNTKKGAVRVHVLVAKAFIPIPEGKTQVDHIDNCKTNNRVNNLQWVTSQENTAKAGRSGALARHEKRKPVVAVNLETFRVLHLRSQADAETITGIDNRNISACIRKHRLKTGSYKFYYEKDWRKT
jgi:hypothetical protein